MQQRRVVVSSDSTSNPSSTKNGASKLRIGQSGRVSSRNQNINPFSQRNSNRENFSPSIDLPTKQVIGSNSSRQKPDEVKIEQRESTMNSNIQRLLTQSDNYTLARQNFLDSKQNLLSNVSEETNREKDQDEDDQSGNKQRNSQYSQVPTAQVIFQMNAQFNKFEQSGIGSDRQYAQLDVLGDNILVNTIHKHDDHLDTQIEDLPVYSTNRLNCLTSPTSKQKIEDYQTDRTGLKKSISDSRMKRSAYKSISSLSYAMNLRDKNLEKLSSQISNINVETLQVLDISGNRFQIFPMDLLLLKNLKIVKLDNCLLRSIPDQLYSELKLEAFSVSNNLIQEISGEIYRLKDTLQHLNISKNHIKCLQTSICMLANLTSLNVCSNDFLEIPCEMAFLTNLNEFSIDWFKYCAPQLPDIASGPEGSKIISEIFKILQNSTQGQLTFFEFTSYFSENEKSSRKIELDQDQGVEPHNKNGMIDLSMCSFSECVLPKEGEGIQMIPHGFGRVQNKLVQKTFVGLDELEEEANNNSLLIASRGKHQNFGVGGTKQRDPLIMFTSQTDLNENVEADIDNQFDADIVDDEEEGAVRRDFNGMELVKGNNNLPFELREIDIDLQSIQSIPELTGGIIDEIACNLGKQKDQIIKQNLAENARMSQQRQYHQRNPKNGQNLLHLVNIPDSLIQGKIIRLVDIFISIIQAVIDEDISALRSLINLAPSLVNQLDFDGHSALSLSILQEKYFSSKILIFNSANVNVGGSILGSCLIIGVVKMQQYLIRDLIRFGANVNKTDSEGNSPLHYAFSYFSRDPSESQIISNILLEAGALPNAKNKDKWTPLQLAVRSGSVEALKYVLLWNKISKRKFLLNQTGGFDKSNILHIACETNRPDIVKILLENKIDLFSVKTSNKRSLQICQRFTLVKKLIYNQQSFLLEQFIRNKKTLKGWIKVEGTRKKIKKFSRKNQGGSTSQEIHETDSIVSNEKDDFNLETEEDQVESLNGEREEEDVEDESILDDSADLLPIEAEVDASKLSKQRKVPQVIVSSKPRMIGKQNNMSTRQRNQLNPIKEETLNNSGGFAEHNESRISQEDIEDENTSNDFAPMWIYNNQLEIAYSANNLQKVQGVNEVISSILSQENNNGSVKAKKKDQTISAQQAAKMFSFFSNLKNYKQVLNSAQNHKEYQTKVMDESLALSVRIDFLNKLKVLSTKLNQILKLITRQNIYQLFCRSGIIEDFLKLGDDNLNTLLNTSQDMNICLATIYKGLKKQEVSDKENKRPEKGRSDPIQKKSFESNILLALFVDQFGDQNENLLHIFEEIAKKSDLERELIIPKEESGERFINPSKQNDHKKIDMATVYSEKMRIDHSKNVLSDFLEFQQAAKVKFDRFSQKSLITEEEFEKIIPSEEEFSTKDPALSNAIWSYSTKKMRNNSTPFLS